MDGPLNEVKNCFKIIYQSIEIFVEKINIVFSNDDVIAVPVDRHCSFSDGIARAVAAAAGPSFKLDLKKTIKHHYFHPGEVIIFDGHNLKACYVIAAISSSNLMDIQLLYEKIFKCANDKGALSLCVSGIGTGLLEVQCKFVAQAACQALQNFFSNYSENNSLKKIRFVDLKDSVIHSFSEELNRLVAGETGTDVLVSEKTLDLCQSTSNNFDDAELADDFSSFFCTVGNANGKSCAVCLTDFPEDNSENPVVELSKCHHVFHEECIKQAFRLLHAQCPICKIWYSVPRGNQPVGGSMKVTLKTGHLPGYPNSKNYIEICYSIPSGVQTAEHLRPGVPFFGTTRYAYLPNTSDGVLVLDLLRLAFLHRLTFTVGDSVTTGAKNVVVWNNIHHKTTIYGGAFGYPDDGYLDRVKEELASLGINEQLLKKM